MVSVIDPMRREESPKITCICFFVPANMSSSEVDSLQSQQKRITQKNMFLSANGRSPQAFCDNRLSRSHFSHSSERFPQNRPPCDFPFILETPEAPFTWTNEQAGIRRGAGMWGDSLGANSHIKLSQGARRGNPPISLIPPVSLLVGFPDLPLSEHVAFPSPRWRTKVSTSAARSIESRRSLM